MERLKSNAPSGRDKGASLAALRRFESGTRLRNYLIVASYSLRESERKEL